VSLRTRLALASAAALAVTVALASIAGYFVVRGELRGEVDSALRSRADAITRDLFGPPGDFDADIPPPFLGGAGGYVQFVSADGEVRRPPGDTVALPVTDRVLEVAAGDRGAFFSDADVAGTHVRILTEQLEPGVAFQLPRPLTEVDTVLRRLRVILFFGSLGGVVLAAGLGLLIARAALGPVRRLTETTESIAETRDLGERVEATGTDELSRLARSFNTMLGALDESLRAQRQLVADASHELRTPLTSLRTNIELLARGGLARRERERALDDAQTQLAELSALVADVVELAREGEAQPMLDDVRLDRVVADEVHRAERRAPPVRFETRLEELVVHGDRDRLHRAVANILDNAVKWSPRGSVIEVEVGAQGLTVRDHGPGIAPEDLPFVFDRFYRAPAARGTPGSGLGLAIVRKVAELHGGSVSAERADGGGTRVRLKLSPTS
jgi:two-component system sensor histidine kinase MprB